MTKTNNKIGLYLHVPFCVRKCNYCDFLSFSCSDESILAEYADALVMEIESRYTEWPYRVVDSIFIGGGTPSLMASKDMVRVINAIRNNFLVSEDCEITIESNPGTLTDEKLEDYLNCGINRLSIGVQSFDNTLLKMLGRIHDKNEAFNAIRMARKAGFQNVNVDMMFGIPGQTEKMWRDSFRQCLFQKPEHVSFYSLQVEEGTRIHKMIYEDKILSETPPTLDRRMYHDGLIMLEEAGYHQYEISNAALAGYECRHNLKYWSYEEYLGLGPGASSFIGGHRFKNCENVPEYLKYIKAGKPPVRPDDVENYSQRDEMGVYMFTGLRKREGVNINDFEDTFGVDFFKVYDPGILKTLEGLLESEGLNLRLTDKGFDVANKVMAAFV